ncbi:galactose oxidase/kelch repeat superfamily protein, partial [Striga asiatica]
MYKNTGKYVGSHRPTSSSSSSAATAAGSASIPYHPLHHQITIPFSSGGGIAGDDDFSRRDKRFPQWGNQETRDLIEIRAQFEVELAAEERDMNLWEAVANGMRVKGYRRTPEQCKGKWKDLVSRYKEHETLAADNNIRHCLFFDELHAIFTARSNHTQPPHPTATARENQSREEFSQEPDNEQETDPEHSPKTRIPPKRRQKTAEIENHPTPSHKTDLDSLHEIMKTFIVSQQRMDMQWMESMEKYAKERELLEDGWRKKMEGLERERLMLERAFREREEQRRLKEESRAEKRDELFTMLLNKLIPQICLSLVPPSVLYSVCRSWRRLIYSQFFPPFLSLYAVAFPSAAAVPPDTFPDPIEFLSFDPISRRWCLLPPPPSDPDPPRFLFRHPTFICRDMPVQSVSAAGTLVVLAATDDLFLPALPRPLVFDPLASSWSCGPRIPAPRRWCATGSVGGAVYVAGGMGASYTCGVARSAERWDLGRRPPMVAAAWRRVADLRDVKLSRDAVEVVGWRGRLYMVSAKEGLVYDAAADRWGEMPAGMLG